MVYAKQVERGEGDQKEDEWVAKEVMTRIGLKVTKIRETPKSRTADFRVDGDSLGYLVEAKARELDQRFATRETNVIELAWDPTVNRWLFDTKEQCASVDPMHERLWFVWASAQGPIGFELQAERVFDTLYGVRHVIEERQPNRLIRLVCAGREAFAESPEIDGVIVSVDDNQMPRCGICINNHSPRAKMVRRSKLVRKLVKRGAQLNEPNLLQQRAGYCVIGDDVDLENEAAVLSYAQSKLGCGRLDLVTPTATFKRRGAPIFRNP